uniref:Uncharacterized protein n=1 Tax=Tanacetum cinerariifolium TaxID=118510 RepID=A0A6L2NZW8_TANCI|nr:hypothetical protein [Tanacetum cinerariifolium]
MYPVGGGFMAHIRRIFLDGYGLLVVRTTLFDVISYNLALLRGGATISSIIAASIADDKVTGVRTLFLGFKPEVAHQSQSDPHLMSLPLWAPPEKMPSDLPLEGPPQKARNPESNQVQPTHNPVIVVRVQQAE